MPVLPYMLAAAAVNMVEAMRERGKLTIQPITPELCFSSDIRTKDDEDGGGGERECHGEPQPNLSAFTSHVRRKGCLAGVATYHPRPLPGRRPPWYTLCSLSCSTVSVSRLSGSE